MSRPRRPPLMANLAEFASIDEEINIPDWMQFYASGVVGEITVRLLPFLSCRVILNCLFRSVAPWVCCAQAEISKVSCTPSTRTLLTVSASPSSTNYILELDFLTTQLAVGALSKT
jgi:hypothetical protein